MSKNEISELEPQGNTVPDETNLQSYIGCKIIKARPMDQFTFLREIKNKPIPDHENSSGYLVEYPDNYLSWSPANVFEKSYRIITESEKSMIL